MSYVYAGELDVVCTFIIFNWWNERMADIEREIDLFSNSLIIYINIYNYIIVESREEIARTKVA